MGGISGCRSDPLCPRSDKTEHPFTDTDATRSSRDVCSGAGRLGRQWRGDAVGEAFWPIAHDSHYSGVDDQVVVGPVLEHLVGYFHGWTLPAPGDQSESGRLQ